MVIRFIKYQSEPNLSWKYLNNITGANKKNFAHRKFFRWESSEASNIVIVTYQDFRFEHKFLERLNLVYSFEVRYSS